MKKLVLLCALMVLSCQKKDGMQNHETTINAIVSDVKYEDFLKQIHSKLKVKRAHTFSLSSTTTFPNIGKIHPGLLVAPLVNQNQETLLVDIL